MEIIYLFDGGHAAIIEDTDEGTRELLIMAPEPAMFAIYCESDMDLAWSNTDGWVSGPDFDIFTSAERSRLSLPIGGVWRLIAGNPLTADDPQPSNDTTTNDTNED